jgi:thioredoxin reductase
MIDTVIVGAGPYGLSIAAHCRGRGITCRIFGKTMDTWTSHMPKGMHLKSDGFASNLSDPQGQLTLEKFCKEKGIEYGHTGIPVRLETFCSYGETFKQRLLSDIDERMVHGVERMPDGFQVTLEDGETVKARRVVLAIGITHYQYVPEALVGLPSEMLSHSYFSGDLESLRGKDVVVIGAGSSATDTAGLLKQAGANVTLVARRRQLIFHTNSMGKKRSLWQRIRKPSSGLGPGMRSRLFCDYPWAFRFLPEGKRLKIVRNYLGPAGGWFARDLVIGKVPLMLGHTIESASVRDGKAQLILRKPDGTTCEVLADKVIAATGYKAETERLEFLSPELRSQIKTTGGFPVLSQSFESSVPDLYFAGVSAAGMFGPVMRFAFGARYTAGRISKALAKAASRERVVAPATSVVLTK